MRRGWVAEYGLARAFRAALLGAVGALAVAVEAAPLGLSPVALPSPDLLFCAVAHWAVRAPTATPVLLVYAIGLGRDLLTDQPVGLGALTLVLAAEAMKARAGALARQPFLAEWIWVAAVAATMAVVQWLVVAISLAQPPYASLLAQQYAATILIYPFVSLVLRWVLRVRERTPRDGGAAARRTP